MFTLDHVVYFTTKEPEIVVREEKEKGSHAVIGGSHLKWGTQNALLYTKNAYVEWLSIENEELAQQVDHPLVHHLLHDLTERGDGWGTLCLSVQDIELLNDRLRGLGYDTTGVLDAERKTASGIVRKWKMLFVKEDITSKLPLPFFIQWEEPDNLRYDALRREGALTAWNEERCIATCILHVKHPERETEKWRKLLQAEGAGNDLQLTNAHLHFKESTDAFERLHEIHIQETS